MTPFILVAYATKKGSTEEVAREITGALAAQGMLTDLRAAHDVDDLEGYDGVVLGSAITWGGCMPMRVGSCIVTATSRPS